MDAVLAQGLARVAEQGAPAQQVEARRLASILEGRPDDVGALTAAVQLVDAYLHDPYLERG